MWFSKHSFCRSLLQPWKWNILKLTGQEVTDRGAKRRNAGVSKCFRSVKTVPGLNGPLHDPPGLGSRFRPLRKVWGLEVSNHNDLLVLLASFLGFFNSEMRHWINCVDYEGPPCSLTIIKIGFPGGDACSNFAVTVSASGLESWLSESGNGRGASEGKPVSFPPWWMSLLAVQC